MMNQDYPAIAPERAPRTGLRTTLIVTLVAFAAGIGLMVWAVSSSDVARRWLGIEDEAKVPAGSEAARGRIDAMPATIAAIPADEDIAITDIALNARVRDLERKLAEIDMADDAASTNAGRAEGLLIAFAARRALDRGLALGYIEGQLRARFGEAQPRAVASIIRAARQPVTLEQLEIGLEALGPELQKGTPGASWWDGFRAQLSQLVVVRRAGTPSPDPVERYKRALRQLEGGQVDAALAEVARMPGRAVAERWIADARRYNEARQALDIIETAAILAPGQPPAAAN